jgi:hypothetical protein
MRFVPEFGAAGGALPWSPPVLDAFQPARSFDIFSNPAGSSADFRPAPGFGNHAQATFGFNSMNSPDFGKAQGSVAPLFPTGRASELFAITPPALPSLNLLMRGSFNFPPAPTANTFKLAYRDAPEDLFRPSPGLFTTTDLGNGMFFSAGTSIGRSTAGVPAAGLNGNASADGKHSGPAVAFKLSF